MSITADGADPGRRAYALLVVGVGCLLCAMLVVAALQYVTPPGFRNAPGASPEGVALYRGALPVGDMPRVPLGQWVVVFRVALGAAWIAYAVVLGSAQRLRGRVPAWILFVVVLSLGLFALVTPPSLSRDVYAYAGYGRMPVAYGLNPYTTSLAETARLGDPAAMVAPLPVPTVYGPVWTALAACVAALPGGLGVHVMSFKLVGAVSSIALAVFGGSAAATFDPRTRYLAVMAIGLNPLVLLEGAGNAHNDVFMMALLLGAVALLRRGRSSAAYLVLGLSIAVKFVPLALLPWMVLEHVRSAAPSSRLRIVVLATVLALAPTALGLAAMGGAAPVWDSLVRVQTGVAVSAPGSQAGAPAGSAAAEGEAAASQQVLLLLTVLFAAAIGALALLLKRMWSDRVPAVAGAALVAAAFAGLALHRSPPLLQLAVGLVAYAALTYWIAARGGPGAYLAGWPVLAVLGVAIVAPYPFPWYALWPFPTALTRSTWLHRGLAYGAVVIGALCTFAYTRVV